MRTLALSASLSMIVVGLAGGARADGQRTYDASLGTTPEQQGFGDTFNLGITHAGSTTTPPTVVNGALHSDTTGTPGSTSGHQFWFEWSDLYCDFREGVSFLEFVVKVNSSSYAQDGSYTRTGWTATLGDGHLDSSPSNVFIIGLTDQGYEINTDSYQYLNPPASTPRIPLRPFDTTSDFHDYKAVITKDGMRFYIDGVLRETIAPLWAPANPFAFGFAVFGDGNGIPSLNVTSNTDLKLFRYGCTQAEPPTITCPAGDAEECKNGGAAASYAPTADGHGLPVTIACTPPSGSVFPLGTSQVTCTATSDAGQASCSFPVKVADTLPPTVQSKDMTLYEDSEAVEAALVTVRDGDGKRDGKKESLWPFRIADCVAQVSDRCGDTPVLAISRIEWWPNAKAEDLSKPDKRPHLLTHALDKFARAGCDEFALNGSGSALLPVRELDDGAGGAYRVYFSAIDASGNATSASCTVRVLDDEDQHDDSDPHDAPQPLGCLVCVGSGCGNCPSPAVCPDK